MTIRSMSTSISPRNWNGRRKAFASARRRDFPSSKEPRCRLPRKAPVQLQINLRIPYWAKGGSVKINGAALPAFASPSSYLALNRVWKTGRQN